MDEFETEKDYGDMIEEELAEVKGRVRASDDETEYDILLDAIKVAEGIAYNRHKEVWIYEWDTGRWAGILEVDGRIGA